MRIVQLNAENVKRLRAVEIRPEGAVVQITGRNAQGKTSVMDAIEMGLCGRVSECPEPVRRGQESAFVEVNLGDLVVRRVWTDRGAKSHVTVTNPEGAKLPSPQAVLDKITGRLTFDPLAFMRMKPAEQLDTLKRVTGLDLSDFDNRRKAAFDQRTDVNRAVKSLDGAIAQMPIVDGPDAEVSISDLLQQQNAALEQERQNRHRAAVVSECNERIARNTQRIAQLEADLASARKDLEAGQALLRDAEAALAQNRDTGLEAIQQRISGAEQQNRLARQRREREAKIQERDSLVEKAQGFTETIEAIDGEKARLISEAKMPVEGLGFGDGCVLYGGLPLEQASGAESLRVSLAISAALNPTLRIMLIRDGSLLDSSSMALLQEWAAANDAQVWIERVDESGQVGVCIEDGQVI